MSSLPTRASAPPVSTEPGKASRPPCPAKAARPGRQRASAPNRLTSSILRVPFTPLIWHNERMIRPQRTPRAPTEVPYTSLTRSCARLPA